MKKVVDRNGIVSNLTVNTTDNDKLLTEFDIKENLSGLLSLDESDDIQCVVSPVEKFAIEDNKKHLAHYKEVMDELNKRRVVVSTPKDNSFNKMPKNIYTKSTNESIIRRLYEASKSQDDVEDSRSDPVNTVYELIYNRLFGVPISPMYINSIKNINSINGEKEPLVHSFIANADIVDSPDYEARRKTELENELKTIARKLYTAESGSEDEIKLKNRESKLEKELKKLKDFNLYTDTGKRIDNFDQMLDYDFNDYYIECGVLNEDDLALPQMICEKLKFKFEKLLYNSSKNAKVGFRVYIPKVFVDNEISAKIFCYLYEKTEGFTKEFPTKDEMLPIAQTLKSVDYGLDFEIIAEYYYDKSKLLYASDIKGKEVKNDLPQGLILEGPNTIV